jgi:hypothetical protein
MDSVWFRGQLIKREEFAKAKQQFRRSDQSQGAWRLKLAGWRKALAGNLEERTAALAELKAVRDPEAIAVIEQVTLDPDVTSDLKIIQTRQLSMALFEALGGMPPQHSMTSIIRHAIFSPLESVRATALDRLKQRPLQDYVPILLDSLAAPVESTFSVGTGLDGSVYHSHSFYRAGRFADWSLDAANVLRQRDLEGRRTFYRNNGKQIDLGPAHSEAEVQAEMAAVAAASRRKFAIQAVSLEKSLKQINESTRAANERIIPILQATTGQELGNDPRAWWNWWDQHNEYYSERENPLYDYWYCNVGTYYYAQPSYAVEPPPPGTYSCFAKGTPVWTKTGPRPIESLRIGDMVLSQNADTGELAYKPVMGTTIRPPSSMITVRIGKEQIFTTLGHPFWVAGTGWQMAKELSAGALLHGVKEPARITAAEPAAAAEAYNLVVADFATYFVGDSGILVHDNTPRRPTQAIVPGLAAK